MSFPALIDFWLMYHWGEELFRGQYTSVYPYPALGWFAIYTFLPGWVSGALLSFGSLAIMVALTRRRAFFWLFYTPFVHLLTIGQIDMLCLGLCTVGSPVALALMTLKPQLFIFALPRLLRFDRAQWQKFWLWVTVLYGPITLLRPGWVGEWYQNTVAKVGPIAGGSFWSHPELLLLLLIPPLITYLKKRRFNYQGYLLTLHPSLVTYDYSLLVGRSLWLIPASWVLWYWWLTYHSLDWRFGYLWGLLGLLAVLTDPPPQARVPIE